MLSSPPGALVALKEESIVTCKSGRVELGAELDDAGPGTSSSAFLEAVRDRLVEHQYQLMTDPAILYPLEIECVSSLVSRDPLPNPMKEGLISLGFRPMESQQGGIEESSLFSRFQRGKKRTKLDRWELPYLRASEVSERLGELEAALVEEMPREPLAKCHEAASGVLSANFRTLFRVLVSPGLEGLEQVESLILKERSQARGRLILHPFFVRALAAFAGDSIIQMAPDTVWSTDSDEDFPLHIQARGGLIVESDPELRAVSFVREGRNALLSQYARSVVEQSLTAARNP